MVALHQWDLLEYPELCKTGIGFDVDFNNHETIDLSIKLALTENVVVKDAGAGRLQVRHPGEPQMTPAYMDAFWQVYAGEYLLADPA